MIRATLMAAASVLILIGFPSVSADGIWDHVPGGQPDPPGAIARELIEDLGLDTDRMLDCVDVSYYAADRPDPAAAPSGSVEQVEGGTEYIITTGSFEVVIFVADDCLGSFGPRPQSDDGLPG